MARLHRDPQSEAQSELKAAPEKIGGPKSYRSLYELSTAELREEALYDDDLAAEAVDSDQLREEVRWRRAAVLREPGNMALAKLLAAVHEEDSVETLTQGHFSPAQLIEKSEDYILMLRARKLSRIPNLEDHERRLAHLEATLFSDRQVASEA